MTLSCWVQQEVAQEGGKSKQYTTKLSTNTADLLAAPTTPLLMPCATSYDKVNSALAINNNELTISPPKKKSAKKRDSSRKFSVQCNKIDTIKVCYT